MRTILHKIKNRILRAPKEEIDVLDLNTRYDLETVELIKKLGTSANCIDVGAHRGDILKSILTYAPQGQHFAFEPIPHLVEGLQKEYGHRCKVYSCALSDENGQTEFNYVISNPAYSGIKKRRYDRQHEEDTLISVEKRRLDDVIPKDTPVHFIKIDVEGGEFQVVKGATRILETWKPLVIYEQGLGGSDVYGTDPGTFFDYMSGHGYKISLMEYYLLKKKPLSREDYCTHFHNGYNFYFIAYNQDPK